MKASSWERILCAHNRVMSYCCGQKLMCRYFWEVPRTESLRCGSSHPNSGFLWVWAPPRLTPRRLTRLDSRSSTSSTRPTRLTRPRPLQRNLETRSPRRPKFKSKNHRLLPSRQNLIPLPSGSRAPLPQRWKLEAQRAAAVASAAEPAPASYPE